ncbi:LuxR C-terminal-related transcriptional regulator [Nonomuraea rubra]|uniref:LuxR C-terminal-related transcriptional regulator n=1 Tax=Nonomuraea rubra TaxID=46180 RepID=UPI003610B4C0
MALGRATELDRVAPLSTLSRALGDSGASLEYGAFLAIERAGEAIERFSRVRPVAIVLDDVQWADELTCLALRQLVPGLAGSPVVWLLARRPLPEQEAVDRLIAEGARRVPLPPLSPEEAAELCRRLLGAAPGASVLELARAAGGNPFLLEEVLNALREEGRIAVSDGGVAVVREPELPAGFVAAVERRLSDLSGEARRVLEAGAVLRRPFTVHEAAGLLGAAPGTLVGHVEEAVRAGALVGEGDRLAFRHDLIREAVYGGLAAAIRTALHREAALVLRREGRPPAELAEHLRHGARVGDVAAVRELRAAAEEMTAVAPSAAADLMLRALELSGRHHPGPDPTAGAQAAGTGAPGAGEPPPEAGGPAAGTGEPPPGAAGLVAGVVRLLASAGRLDEAREIADAHGAPRDAAERAGIAFGLAEALKHAGDDRTVIARTGRALELSGVPVRERARLLAVRAHALMMTGRIDAADDAAREAIANGEAGTGRAANPVEEAVAGEEATAERAAGSGGEVFAQVVGLQARSTVAIFRGELGDALRYAGRSVELADGAGGETAHRHPRLWLGAALTALDRFEEAQEVYAVVERECGRLGTAWALPLLHRFRAELLLAWGRLDDAYAEAETGLRVAEQLSAMALAPALLGVLGQVTLLRGEARAARELLARGRGLAGDGPGLVAEELRWRSGQAPSAGVLAYLVVQEPWTAARLRRVVPGAVECVRDLARRNPGQVSLAAGAAQAEGRLEEAIELYRAGPRPLGLAAALEEAGRREEAVEVYRSCGAAPPVSAPSAGEGSGWAALTGAELRVVRLVAQGMTNREAAAALFLSPHTIDTHLRHAFAKLGVNSRVELTRQALAHEPPAP